MKGEHKQDTRYLRLSDMKREKVSQMPNIRRRRRI